MEQSRTLPRTKAKKHNAIPGFKSATLNQYLVLMLLIAVGATVGALYIKNAGVGKSQFDGTGFFMQDILSSDAASRGFFALAVSAFFPVSLLICAAFLLGACAIGFPFELLVPVVHGVWIGASMGAIDVRYGVKGLGICLLFILPQALITSVAVMVAAREGFRFSRSLSKTVFGGVQKIFSAAWRIYCFKYAVCFLLAAVSAMVESFSIIMFSKVFFT